MRKSPVFGMTILSRVNVK